MLSVFVRARLCQSINHRVFRVARTPWTLPAHLLYGETELIEGKGFAKTAPSVSGRAGTRIHITAGNADVWGKRC